MFFTTAWVIKNTEERRELQKERKKNRKLETVRWTRRHPARQD
jgi:hypothetical protein